MRRAIVTVGLGFGDEGKGAAVDFLCRHHGADLVGPAPRCDSFAGRLNQFDELLTVQTFADAFPAGGAQGQLPLS